MSVISKLNIIKIKSQTIAGAVLLILADSFALLREDMVNLLRLKQNTKPQNQNNNIQLQNDDVLLDFLEAPTTNAADATALAETHIERLSPLPVDDILFSAQPSVDTIDQTGVWVAIVRRSKLNEIRQASLSQPPDRFVFNARQGLTFWFQGQEERQRQTNRHLAFSLVLLALGISIWFLSTAVENRMNFRMQIDAEALQMAQERSTLQTSDAAKNKEIFDIVEQSFSDGGAEQLLVVLAVINDVFADNDQLLSLTLSGRTMVLRGQSDDPARLAQGFAQHQNIQSAKLNRQTSSRRAKARYIFSLQLQIKALGELK